MSRGFNKIGNISAGHCHRKTGILFLKIQKGQVKMWRNLCFLIEKNLQDRADEELLYKINICVSIAKNQNSSPVSLGEPLSYSATWDLHSITRKYKLQGEIIATQKTRL